MSVEQRRGARFPARIWVRETDLLPEGELCRGNISVSGIFFETTQDFGKPGKVRSLNLASLDQSLSIDIMGEVIRVVAYDDIWKGKVIVGVAFEFLVESDRQRIRIEQFVRHLAGLHIEQTASEPVDHRFTAQVQSQDQTDHRAIIHKLGLTGMVMETDWPMDPGETINVRIEAPASGKTIHLSGKAVKANPATLDNGTTGYQVEVQFAKDPPAVDASSLVQQLAGSSISEAVEILLTEAIVWPQKISPSPRADLRGSMSHVRMENLLAFLDLQRSTGVLRLIRGQITVELFFRDGSLVDAIASHSERAAPLGLLGEVAGWPDGEFEFLVQSVEREDVVGTPTSILLNDLARQREQGDHHK